MTSRILAAAFCALPVMATGLPAFAAGGKNTTQPVMTCAGVQACVQQPSGSFAYPKAGSFDNRGDGDWRRSNDPRLDGNWRKDSRDNDGRYRNHGPFAPYGWPGPVRAGVPY